MLTALAILVSLGVAGALAWATRRYELSREPAASACSGVVDAVFSKGGSNAPDSLMLAQLLEYRDQCTGDATYVDQTRRLMLNLQKVDDARAFIEHAERLKAMTPDELAAQRAWIDLTAAHIEWTNGNQAGADQLRNRAVAVVNELRRKWPEWVLPYTILTEADRYSWKPSTDSATVDYYELERSARGRIANGAFVRRYSDWQPMVYVFVLSAIGMFGLCAGISGLLDFREMTGTPTSAIADAKPGYVEVKGTLQPVSDSALVFAPRSKARVLWFEISRRSGMKGSRTTYERSANAFMLRDASGVVTIDPTRITVYTRHITADYGSAFSTGGHVSEKSLHADDTVYALGQLSVSSAGGQTLRHLRVADNGRRLLVSNLSEDTLVRFAKGWLWVGVSVFVAALIVLVWSFHQRYGVISVPGVLR